MAEINTAPEKSGRIGVRKSKKLSTKVDLTPMVDLGFLLITFFILTTKWSEAKAAKLVLPADGTGDIVCNSCALTVIPTKDDKIFYYLGELNEALEKGYYGYSNYSFDKGIGVIIRSRQSQLESKGKPRNDLVLIIKPTNEAAYGNVVDLLDEVMINGVTRYAITDIPNEEKQILKNVNLF